NPTTCMPSYSCNGTSSCTPNYANTTVTCSNGNLCQVNDHCDGAGNCVGTNISCNSPDQCHTGTGTCSPSTGVCSYTNAANNLPCSLGLTCVSGTTCQNGVCNPQTNSCNWPTIQYTYDQLGNILS